MKQETGSQASWALLGKIENQHLSDLLSLASTNYGRQTDWFLSHHKTGVKNLAAILAAESALVSLATTQKRIPSAFILVLLVVLAIVAPVLAWLAVRACRRAFIAAMESVFMMSKVAWAMGATTKVAVDKSTLNGVKCPGYSDNSLYTPRWIEDALAHATCGGFVEANIENRKNTLFLTKLTIIIFGVGGCTLGFLGVVLILVNRF